MPGFPIVDSHVHLYDPGHFPMPWLEGFPPLNRPFGLDDFRAHSAGIAVEGIVFLEVDVAPQYALLEARWVADLARREPLIQGIVAQAPVDYGERARAFYQALVDVGPLVKGVRRITQGEPDADIVLRPDFVRGAQALAEYGLSFDLACKHHQLAQHVELVRRCPQTSFILDHIAKPNIKERLRDPWWQQIAEMAALPNVVCKLSGVVTEADWERWTVDDVRPYMERVLEVFGEDRVLFGGDWSVVLLAAPYKRWHETVETVTEPLSDAAKHKLWRDNARRVYRLG
jgi:L-fuconolactonase